MEIKKGIAVSPGVSIGKSLIVDSEDYRIPRREIESSQRAGEIQRVRSAFRDAIEELTSLERGQDEATGGHIKDIFAVHLRFLRDRSLQRRITDIVRKESVTAEFAVSSVLREIASHFETNVKDTYISERAADIYDIERRLLRRLLGTKREDILRLKEEVDRRRAAAQSHANGRLQPGLCQRDRLRCRGSDESRGHYGPLPRDSRRGRLGGPDGSGPRAATG